MKKIAIITLISPNSVANSFYENDIGRIELVVNSQFHKYVWLKTQKLRTYCTVKGDTLGDRVSTTSCLSSVHFEHPHRTSRYSTRASSTEVYCLVVNRRLDLRKGLHIKQWLCTFFVTQSCCLTSVCGSVCEWYRRRTSIACLINMGREGTSVTLGNLEFAAAKVNLACSGEGHEFSLIPK